MFYRKPHTPAFMPPHLKRREVVFSHEFRPFVRSSRKESPVAPARPAEEPVRELAGTVAE